VCDMFSDWILNTKYYRCEETDRTGIPLVISGTGWTAAGYEICPRAASRRGRR
jgi:hypothetical protein